MNDSAGTTPTKVADTGLRILDLKVRDGACLPIGKPLIRLVLQVPALASERRGVLASTLGEEILVAAEATGGEHRARATEIRADRADTGEDPPGDLALLVARTAVLLQQLLGFEVAYAASASPGVRDREVALMAYRNAAMAVHAVRLAVDLIGALLSPDAAAENTAERIHNSVRRFLAAGNNLGPSGTAGSILREADRRGIPWFSSPSNPSVLQLGQGPKIQKFDGFFTGRTSFLGWRVSNHKHSAAALLRDHGLPGPRNSLVSSEAQAVAVAERFGFPIVVKPGSTDFGTAVSVDLGDTDAVRKAYKIAATYGQVLVEKHIPGDHFRLVVLHGKFVSAACFRPAQVTGDGRHSVRELVALANEPRSDFLSDKLKRIAVDAKAEHVLEQQDLTLDDIPDENRTVLLRGNSNLSEGGSLENVAHLVHPENRDMAERAARIFDLDVCGIDYLTHDVTRPYHETGGGICEVNASPAALLGDGPNLGRLLVDALYPDGDDGRVPTAIVLGSAIGAPLARALAAILAEADYKSGCATWQDARIDGKRIFPGDCTGAEAGRMLLHDPGVDAAVFETDHRKVIEQGLALDRCSVAVLPTPPPAEAGKAAEQVQAQRRQVKAMLVDCCDSAVVLDAVDPDFEVLRDRAAGRAVYAVSLESAPEAQPEALRRHISAGGLAVVLERDTDVHSLSLRENGRRVRLTTSSMLPAIQPGAKEDQMRVVCFAMAGALALGQAPEVVASVLAQTRA